MFSTDNLGGFLRLLVSHISIVIDEGERLLDFYSSTERHDLLLQAIESGEPGLVEEQLSLCRDYEALFVLQMSHAREWVDRLGRLDQAIERHADEFLAATFGIERLLAGRAQQKSGYNIENRLVATGSSGVLRDRLRDAIDVEGMLLALFELLARLEEHYDLVEELLAERPLPVPAPFAARADAASKAEIVPLFERRDGRPELGDKPLPH
jgi:hypothetical protein